MNGGYLAFGVLAAVAAVGAGYVIFHHNEEHPKTPATTYTPPPQTGLSPAEAAVIGSSIKAAVDLTTSIIEIFA